MKPSGRRLCSTSPHKHTHTEVIGHSVTSHMTLNYFQTWLHVIIIIGSRGSASAQEGHCVVTDIIVRFKGHSLPINALSILSRRSELEHYTSLCLLFNWQATLHWPFEEIEWVLTDGPWISGILYKQALYNWVQCRVWRLALFKVRLR